MTHSEPGRSGPVDFALVAFEGDKPTRRGASELLARVDSGLVDVRAVHVIGRAADGSAYRMALSDTTPSSAGMARQAWSATGLVSDEDVDAAAAAMEPGSLAVLVVYENPGSVPFVGAPWMSGGRLVASARLAADAASGASDTNVPAPDAAGE